MRYVITDTLAAATMARARTQKSKKVATDAQSLFLSDMDHNLHRYIESACNFHIASFDNRLWPLALSRRVVIIQVFLVNPFSKNAISIVLRNLDRFQLMALSLI